MSLSPLRLLAAALLPAVALLALSLPGCGLSQPYPAIRSFTLEAKADPPSRKRGRSPVLQVTAVGAAAACETRKLVYKIGPNELSEDFYNELTGQPARMAADATARYLEATGAYRAERSATIEGPDLTLGLFMEECHGDFVSSPPRAVMAIRYTLTDMRRQKVVLSRTYQAAVPLSTGAGVDRPSELAAGLGKALGEILSRLEPDLFAAAR